VCQGNLVREMQSCFQSAGQNMLEHGEAVARAFEVLHAHLTQQAPLPPDWTLPSWLDADAARRLLARLPDSKTLAQYHVYHDCGKPRCRTVDETGRQHFPNHADVSKAVWLEYGGDAEVATLIGMDMDVHLLKAEDVETFSRRPQAAALLLTALAEVFANAAMFGGTGSTSFKIKFKHLERRGKAIIQNFKEV
jgi:hypothetical protein